MPDRCRSRRSSPATNQTGGNALYLHDPASKNPLRLTGAYGVANASLSPDGRWLALCADLSGSWQLYARALTGDGALQPLSMCPGGAAGLEWSRTASEIVFVRAGNVVVIAYALRDGRVTAQREQLVPLGNDSQLLGLGRDGRFLIGTAAAGTRTRQGIRVIVGGLSTLLSPQVP